MMAASNSVEPLKITDVTPNCLIEIFEYLGLPDLLNVADSNKTLKSVAVLVYQRKHVKECAIKVSQSIPFVYLKRFEIGGSCERFDTGLKAAIIRSSYRSSGYTSPFSSGKKLPQKYHPRFGKSKNLIYLSDLYNSLRFLRCFGNYLTRLNIDCLGWFNNDDQIINLFHYINKYTSHNLIDLQMSYVIANINETMILPFEKVETLSLEGGKLDADHSSLNKWFPKIRHLKIRETDDIKFGGHFPNLETFDFCKMDYDSKKREEVQLELFVRFNTQLESITIREYLNGEFIRLMSQKLNKVKELRFISVGPSTTVSHRDTDMNLVCFRSVVKVHIDVEHELFNLFVPTFDQLEDFTVEQMNLERLRPFFEKHKKITNLTLKRVNYNEKNILELARVLPLLSILDISDAKENGFTVNNVERFMYEFKQLNKFKVKIEFQKSNDTKLGKYSGWREIQRTNENSHFTITYERPTN